MEIPLKHPRRPPNQPCPASPASSLACSGPPRAGKCRKTHKEPFSKHARSCQKIRPSRLRLHSFVPIPVSWTVSRAPFASGVERTASFSHFPGLQGASETSACESFLPGLHPSGTFFPTGLRTKKQKQPVPPLPSCFFPALPYVFPVPGQA